jgi:hypothetical protein
LEPEESLDPWLVRIQELEVVLFRRDLLVTNLVDKRTIKACFYSVNRKVLQEIPN